MLRSGSPGELLRFAVVGIASNLALLTIFVLLVHWGSHPTVAMTLTYALGVLQTFPFQRRWTFRHQAEPGPALRRYVALHLFCWLLNLALLALLVESLGWPAAGVQAGAILLNAALLFAGQKYWVFNGRRGQAPGAPPPVAPTD